MNKVGILFNPIKAGLKEKASELAALLGKDLSVWVSETGQEAGDWKPIETDSDLVVVFGGDGTFLSTARFICEHGIPILGINHGHLGFLSESADIELKELADVIIKNKLIIEKRSMLKVSVSGQKDSFNALNDIVINRSHYSNLLYTDLYIENELLSSFRSDGLVICTPTGSTAYALSAGGSVMDPGIAAFQIVPIAPHSLTSRPHVISDDQTIVLESKDKIGFFMQADGQELIDLEPGVKLTIQKSAHHLQLAHIKDKRLSFYNILRDKLHWGTPNG